MEAAGAGRQGPDRFTFDDLFAAADADVQGKVTQEEAEGSGGA
jgi:hypothetical protein